MKIRLNFGQKLSNRLPKNFLPYNLISFANSNFAEDFRDCKSVIGYSFFLNAIVFQYNKIQRTDFITTFKVQYITLGYIVKKDIQIQQFIKKMKLDVIEDLILHDNNKMIIELRRNVKSKYCVKYINIQYYYIQKMLNKRKLIIKLIPRLIMLTEGMIKVLFTKIFKKYQALIEMSFN